MSAVRTPDELQANLGWNFREPARLLEALTHSTYANENQGAGPDNERLEFLGDAVLGLMTATLLFARPEAAGEGEMSRRRARIVRAEGLATLARQLGLQDHLRLGHGQRADGVNTRILADAYEALVGAVYLDGGWSAVESCFGDSLRAAIDEASHVVDFKTQLQELCHLKGMSVPRYRVVSIDGPDHAKRFTCEVVIAGEVRGQGEGSSKKTAEQQCAAQAFALLNAETETDATDDT